MSTWTWGNFPVMPSSYWTTSLKNQCLVDQANAIRTAIKERSDAVGAGATLPPEVTSGTQMQKSWVVAARASIESVIPYYYSITDGGAEWPVRELTKEAVLKYVHYEFTSYRGNPQVNWPTSLVPPGEEGEWSVIKYEKEDTLPITTLSGADRLCAVHMNELYYTIEMCYLMWDSTSTPVGVTYSSKEGFGTYSGTSVDGKSIAISNALNDFTLANYISYSPSSPYATDAYIRADQPGPNTWTAVAGHSQANILTYNVPAPPTGLEWALISYQVNGYYNTHAGQAFSSMDFYSDQEFTTLTSHIAMNITQSGRRAYFDGHILGNAGDGAVGGGVHTVSCKLMTPDNYTHPYSPPVLSWLQPGKLGGGDMELLLVPNFLNLVYEFWPPEIPESMYS